MFFLAQELGEPIDSRLHGLSDWPWSWVRIAFYVQRIKMIHQKAEILHPDNPEWAVPLRWVMFDDERLEEWWQRFKMSGAMEG